MSNEDIQHLDLLSLFHYILGGIIALFSCMPFIHVFMGLALVFGKLPQGNQSAAVPSAVGWIFVVMGSVFILLGWSLAVCMLLTGKKLKRRHNRTFCMVVAGIECMVMPFGTLLGIFTIMALSKDSTKEIFEPSGKEPPSASGS